MRDILIVKPDGPTTTLTLNRPEKRNALSRALVAEMTAALRAIAADDAVRSVILTGAPPAFSAGLDLKEVAASSFEQADADATALLEMLELIDHLPKPVIAAIPGPAVAGGAGLASVCDIVLCARSAVVGYPEVKRGLVAAIVMTYLRRVVGERDALQLLLTGEHISAERALAIGWCTEVVEDDALLARAGEFAAIFASFPPDALANTKRLWNSIRPMDDAAALQQARDFNAAMRTSGESRDAIGRFFDG